MDGHNFSIYTDNRKNAQLNFFNDFFKNDSLRKEYNNYAISTIEYGFAVDRLLYVWKKRIKNQTVSLDSNYYTFETKSFIENMDAFNCPGYIHFLKFYIKDKYERKLEGGEIAVDNSKKMIPAVEKFTLTTKLLDRPFSDVVIYNIILNDMHDVSNAETSGYTDSLPLDSMIIYFKEKYSLLR